MSVPLIVFGIIHLILMKTSILRQSLEIEQMLKLVLMLLCFIVDNS